MSAYSYTHIEYDLNKLGALRGDSKRKNNHVRLRGAFARYSRYVMIYSYRLDFDNN